MIVMPGVADAAISERAGLCWTVEWWVQA